jgi:ZIP family zinc transporter
VEAIAVSPLLAGFLGSLAAGLMTGVGAAPVFLKRTWGGWAQSLMLAVAGGIMLAATVFSLTVPALELVQERTGSGLQAALVVGIGIAAGAFAVRFIHGLVPHEHLVNHSREGSGRFALPRNWLFIAAIALHNLPEGLSVGVAYGPGTLASGLPVTFGIGLQNMPEGLAVAAALLSAGFSRKRAFVVAFLTGLIEPVGGLIGGAVVGLSAAILPLGLAFAAGAMLFVIVGEVIPETFNEGRQHGATMVFVHGFLVMMLLDVTLG